ncbi:MAG: hypothetical protein ACRECF_06455, partial [Methyloceanibacter sp.]
MERLISGKEQSVPNDCRDTYASVFRNCRGNVIAILLFVRRNDILLQRGMTLQVMPLPSLGVSSLDLGRS